VSNERPASAAIVSILTFVAVLPSLVEQVSSMFTSEVAFTYDYRMIDFLSRLGYNTVLLLAGLIVGSALLNRQKWAWFVNIGLQPAIIFVQLASGLYLAANETGSYVGFDSSVGRYLSIIISGTVLYLQSRGDVRGYFQMATKIQ
jgi:hypothetical protein